MIEVILKWDNMFAGDHRAIKAEGRGAVFLVLDTGEHFRVYAMNPFSPLCPINRDRAILYRAVSTEGEAKAVAQEWENGFISVVEKIMDDRAIEELAGLL